MSKKEINQVSIFEKLKAKEIKQKQASVMLGLSTRQIKRKLKSFRKLGPSSLAHSSRGKPGNHVLDPDLKSEALHLVRTEYPDFTPTFASEKLEEIHKLVVISETLRLWMIDDGLWKVKRRKIDRHVWRERKEYFGQLVQLDGSDHDWFEGRSGKCSLLAFIDDATSQILWLEFAKSESTESLMKSTRSYLEKYGRPASLYSDRGSVYKVNLNNEDKDKLTQYGRALKELDIGLIHARSPQAKGRVERLFGTLQNRLVKELRLKGISDMETANEYLRNEYIEKHNQKFSVAPAKEGDVHQNIQGYEFNDIFCLKEERKINNDFTVQYEKRWLQLEAKQPTIIKPKETVQVWDRFGGELTIVIRKTKLNHIELLRKPEKKVLLKERTERVYHIPPKDHPWRNSSLLKRDISILVKR